MKTVKKLVSAVLAMVCGVAMTVPVGVSAEELFDPISMETGDISALTTVYDPCDVNHDGSVDLMDVVAINSYLAGTIKVTNYNVLDANRNLIVDSADSDFVMNKVVGQNPTTRFVVRNYNHTTHTLTEGLQVFPSVGSQFIPDGFNSSQSSRTYMKYSYNTTPHTSEYTLSMPTTQMSSQTGNELTAIVDGTNTMYSTTLPENCALVAIQGCGTGFVVGHHTIAVAAHSVYGENGFITNLTIKRFNTAGNLETGTLTPVEIHIPKLYKECQDYMAQHPGTSESSQKSIDKIQYDYALIKVSQELVDSNHPVVFSLGVPYNTSKIAFTEVPLYVTGTPDSTHLYTERGTICSPVPDTTHNYNYHTDTILYHNVDTDYGDSGAPIYTIVRNNVNNNYTYVYTALGINDGGLTGAHNYGSRITKYHLRFYANAESSNGTSSQSY